MYSYIHCPGCLLELSLPTMEVFAFCWVNPASFLSCRFFFLWQSYKFMYRLTSVWSNPLYFCYSILLLSRRATSRSPLAKNTLWKLVEPTSARRPALTCGTWMVVFLPTYIINYTERNTKLVWICVRSDANWKSRPKRTRMSVPLGVWGLDIQLKVTLFSGSSLLLQVMIDWIHS